MLQFLRLRYGHLQLLEQRMGMLLAGVKVRILINDFDPISEQDEVLDRRGIVPLKNAIAALSARRRIT